MWVPGLLIQPFIITDDVITQTVWLRPSKQIRAPLYSIKQKRQRRWIVRFLCWYPTYIFQQKRYRSSSMESYMLLSLAFSLL
jgi:hypothetical protein